MTGLSDCDSFDSDFALRTPVRGTLPRNRSSISPVTPTSPLIPAQPDPEARGPALTLSTVDTSSRPI
ncbi:hypothetical protein SKAU_G00306850 [Synaphobranchus kaupii]|uniref:Uncharacterized protein n=1 Tax=Synaphobranchus kaupii TaxID=118154 RepID=A0A9Q1EQV6_SYNKA|nr:hypothetical protein SKAU_G00306850 [Synaphobranchus kaupii]